MPKLEPLYLAPAVGFATWHLERGESIPAVLERLRMHCDYCTLNGEEIRACVRRALSDLRRWQRIRHCCGWIEGRGFVSWDEANREMTGDATRRSGAGYSPGDSSCHSGSG